MTYNRLVLNCVGSFTVATAAAGALMAQQVTPVNLGTAAAPAPPAPVSRGADQPTVTTESNSSRYAIQRQDTLTISFPFSPELNETVTVQPDGFINLLGAKSLYAQGLTVPDLIANIKKAYEGVLESPDVTIDVKDFQRPFFTVIGEVNKPGKYDIREDLTVAQALSVAGGIEPSAKTQVFLLHRDVSSWRVEKLDIKDVLNGTKPQKDEVVANGDMIVVPEKFIVKFKQYVPYSFNLGSYFQLGNIP